MSPQASPYVSAAGHWFAKKTPTSRIVPQCNIVTKKLRNGFVLQAAQYCLGTTKALA
jgi:hypothetical protein